MDRYFISSQVARELDHYDRMDFDRKGEFVTPGDACDHADFTLPFGSFYQVFDQKGKFYLCGFAGSKRYWIRYYDRG
jgi:hypothetical protein